MKKIPLYFSYAQTTWYFMKFSSLMIPTDARQSKKKFSKKPKKTAMTAGQWQVISPHLCSYSCVKCHLRNRTSFYHGSPKNSVRLLRGILCLWRSYLEKKNTRTMTRFVWSHCTWFHTAICPSGNDCSWQILFRGKRYGLIMCRIYRGSPAVTQFPEMSLWPGPQTMFVSNAVEKI